MAKQVLGTKLRDIVDRNSQDIEDRETRKLVEAINKVLEQRETRRLVDQAKRLLLERGIEDETELEKLAQEVVELVLQEIKETTSEDDL